jgi:hypothetical protein
MKKSKAAAYPIYLLGTEKRDLALLLKQGKKLTGLRTGRMIIEALSQFLNSKKGDINGNNTQPSSDSRPL